MAHKPTPLKPLSKRAQALLDSIQKESFKAKQKRQSFLHGMKQQLGTIKTKLMQRFKQLESQQKSKQFKSSLYLTFSKSNRLPLRVSVIIVVGLILLFLCSELFKLITIQNRLLGITNEIPQLQKQMLEVKAKIKKKEKERNELNQKIKQLFVGFPLQKDVNNYLGEIINILEENRIRVIDQEINVTPLPPLTSASEISVVNPPASKSIFDVSVPEVKPEEKATAKKAKKKTTKDAAKDKAADAAKDKNSSNQMNANLAQEIEALKKISPPNFNYLLFKINARGNYIDYLRARHMLLDLLPQMNFPLEEIYANNTNSAIEYKLLIEIPYIIEGR